MSFERDWTEKARDLPADWAEARVRLALDHPEYAQRAAELLAPAHPTRYDTIVRIHVHRESGHGVDSTARLLRRLDKEKLPGTLELEDVRSREQEAAAAESQTLTSSWDELLATLPPDWSDVVAELTLTSSDHLEHAALLLSPTQPTRTGRAPVLRFRVARRFGYGVSPQMARRSLERADGEDIAGRLRILWALSDTHNVSTQGPVWNVAGRTV